MPDFTEKIATWRGCSRKNVSNNL